MTNLEAALHGVLPALITPLTPDGLDEDGFQRVARQCLDAGCSGLFVNGTTAEGPWLTRAQRRRAVELAVQLGTAVVAGVMQPGTAPTIEAAQDARAAGADAVAVTTPYYLGSDEAGVARHVRAVADAVALPVLLYNIPQATHSPMSAEVVGELAGDPRVVGIKDSGGDAAFFAALLEIARGQEFMVLQGDERDMAASLGAGAVGIVAGLANVAPGLFVELRSAAAAGDQAEVDRLHRQIAALGEIVESGPYAAAVKGACAHLGLCGPDPAAPGAPVGPELMGKIAAVLDALHAV